MGFQYDIFISFSKKDNLPFPGSDKGWVTNFHRFLEIRLEQLLGQKPKFLYYGNGEKPTASELAKVCVLVSVISPEYVKAFDCVEDIEAFCEACEKKNLDLNDKPRVFKAVKYPVPFDHQHSKIRSLLGYDMFEADAVTGANKELQSFFGPEAEKNFWMKLDDLAHDIYDIITQVQIERETTTAKSDSVYLAETGFDLTLARDLIKRELQRHGYRVLPDQELPVNVREMEMFVKRDLKECRLSIHLIGDSYGDIPQGSDRSIIEIQNQLAADHSIEFESIPYTANTNAFKRLIWLSPNARFTNERQKVFIENLKRDAAKMNAAELLQTPLEDLKNIIRNELNENDADAQIHISESASEFPKVYLIYDKVDAESGKDLAKIIAGKGNEVLHPILQGELMQVRSHHFDNLRKCDVAMIYYGTVNEQWVQMKVLDVLKAPGLGRTKPMVSKTIFVETGPKLNKEKFKNYDISIIENSGNSSVSLEPYMAKINKAK
jgi:hypothetical protein